MYKLSDINLPSTIAKQESYFVLVGFTYNGPVNTPFTIKDSADPYKVLGNSTLADSYVSAKQAGANPLVLRLNGSHATQEIKDKNGTVLFSLRSVEATDSCNEIVVHLFPDHITIKGLYGDRTYLFSENRTVNELEHSLNLDTRYGLGEVLLESVEPMALTSSITDKPYQLYLENGNDGDDLVPSYDKIHSEIFYQEQLRLLTEALLEEDDTEYSHTGELIPYNIDSIVLCDIPHEKCPEAITVLSKFCESKTTEQSSFCSGLIGSFYFADREADNSEGIQDLVAKGNKGRTESYYIHGEVVVGTQFAHIREEEFMPVVASYAAMRYLSPVHIASTNKEISTISTLLSSFRKEDVAMLTSNGYTCIVPSIRKGHVAFKSVNFIENQRLISSRPHYSRSIYHYTTYILSELDSMVGSTLNRLQTARIDTVMNEKIREIVEDLKIYKSIEYDIRVSNYDSIHLNMSFLPYGELESVQSTVIYDSDRRTVVSWR